jgi:carbon monoxide dehydrogenase subunit G
MAHVQANIHINRPQADVFAYVTDVSKEKEWDTGIVDAYADGPIQVGAKLTEVRNFMGRKMESVSEVTVYDPPNRLSQRSVGGPIQSEGEIRCEPMGDGTHVYFDFEIEGSGFFKVAEGLFASQVEKEVNSMIERLKAILEA